MQEYVSHIKKSQKGKIIVKSKNKERNLNEIHNNCNTKHKHLTIDLRKLIEKWKKERKSNRGIARLLGKNHQTINNEIKRESVIQRTDKQRIFWIKKKCFKLCEKKKKETNFRRNKSKNIRKINRRKTKRNK